MVNQAIIIGNVGQTSGGENNFSFTVATNEKWKDKQGVDQQKTQWHNVIAFGKLAEICQNYISKGSLVYVDGKLDYQKYTDKNGVEKFSTKIIANQVRFLKTKPVEQEDDFNF